MERLASLKSWDSDPQRIPTWNAAIQRSGHTDKIIHQAFQDYLTYGIKHPALKYVTSAFAEPWHIVSIAEHLAREYAEKCEQESVNEHKTLQRETEIAFGRPELRALVDGFGAKVAEVSERKEKERIAKLEDERRVMAMRKYCTGIDTGELERLGTERVKKIAEELDAKYQAEGSNEPHLP